MLHAVFLQSKPHASGLRFAVACSCNAIPVSAGMQGYKVEAFPGFEDDGGDAFRFDEKAEASKPSLHHCLDDGLPHSGAC